LLTFLLLCEDAYMYIFSNQQALFINLFLVANLFPDGFVA